MKRMITIVALALIGQAQAQITTNSGDGMAANGITATGWRGNVDIVTGDGPDGSRTPTVYISINSKLWQVFAPSPYSSYYCKVMKKGTVVGQFVEYGYIKCKSADGTQFLGGTIFIDTKTWRVIDFKALAFQTPKTMPFVTIKKIILVDIRNPQTGLFVHHPELDFDQPGINGLLQMEPDGTLHAAILDGGGPYDGLTIVPPNYPIPPPGGPGGHGTNGIYPLWLM